MADSAEPTHDSSSTRFAAAGPRPAGAGGGGGSGGSGGDGRVSALLHHLPLRHQLLDGLLIVAASSLIVVEHGFSADDPPLRPILIHLLELFFTGLYVAHVMWRHRKARFMPQSPQRADLLDWIILGAAGGGAALGLVAPPLWLIFELALCLLLISELWRLNVALARRFYRPGILLPLSFMTLIAVGTPLLMVPRAVTEGKSISFIDSLFTITSAVCVTGLVVKDTGADFSPFGHAIIGVFIQLGGLGIIVFGSVMAMLLGARLGLRENLTLSQMLNDQPLKQITRFVRFVVLSTLATEFVGALIMMPMWHDPTGALTFNDRLALSLFHSVSAFCNAGFSLFSDSFEGYRYSAVTHFVILPLIVLGGLGFPVLDNIMGVLRWRYERWRDRRRGRAGMVPRHAEAELARGRLTLHSKLVLVTTAALYLSGMVGLLASQLWPYAEHASALPSQGQTVRPWRGGETVGESLADASFMSITARTAGFNSMPMSEVEPAGQLVLMSLMMVGASPGGTGGGMKTTTLAVLVVTVFAAMRQRDKTEAFGRQISVSFVRRAATLAAMFIALVTLASLLLLISEPGEPMKVVFEAVSAASTTGLSLGITPDLTVFGKVVIIVTMFLGRVGPLALLGALMFGARPKATYAYPREAVLLG